jgi:putative effector of murein hydrolase
MSLAHNPSLAPALITLTVVAYALARRIAQRYRHPLLQPVLLSGGLLILALSVCRLPVAAYQPAQTVLTWPLGPATVALAVPIYKQRAHLRRAALPLIGGVTLGTLTTIAAVLALAHLGRLAAPVWHALAFKSVTTAIGVELARVHGGDPALVAVFTVLTGVIGATLGPHILTRCRVTDAAARGIALGTIAMAMGTATALEESETAGALAGLALLGAALVTTLLAPV